MNRVKERKNRSVIYLLPMLGENAEKIIKAIIDERSGFENSYFKSEADFDYTDNLKNRIYLVFDSKKIKQDLVNLLASCKNYIRADTLTNDLIQFTFKIPDIYYSDFILFKYGHYSKFSKEYKDLLIKLWPNKLNLKDILNPKKEDLEQLQLILGTNEKIIERESKPDAIKETFKPSNYFKLE